MKLFLLMALLAGMPARNSDINSTLTMAERNYAIEQLENSSRLLHVQLANLTTAQWNFKPTPDSWSIAEVVEHLALAENGVGQIVSGLLSQPTDSSRRKEVMHSDVQIRQIITNRSGKVKAPEMLVPMGKLGEGVNALRVFDAARNQRIQWIRDTKENLRERFWQHPALGTIDLYQAVLFISAHCERHTAQIQELTSRKDFPPAITPQP